MCALLTGTCNYTGKFFYTLPGIFIVGSVGNQHLHVFGSIAGSRPFATNHTKQQRILRFIQTYLKIRIFGCRKRVAPRRMIDVLIRTKAIALGTNEIGRSKLVALHGVRGYLVAIQDSRLGSMGCIVVSLLCFFDKTAKYCVKRVAVNIKTVYFLGIVIK